MVRLDCWADWFLVVDVLYLFYFFYHLLMQPVLYLCCYKSACIYLFWSLFGFVVLGAYILLCMIWFILLIGILLDWMVGLLLWLSCLIECLYCLFLLFLIWFYFIRGGADVSLAWPTSGCRRTESIVSLERGVCSCGELQIFSCLVFSCLIQRQKGSM